MTNTPVNVSIVSILLYISLAVTSYSYYYLLLNRYPRSNDKIISTFSTDFTSKFNEHKKIFFLILGTSAVLDIPLYIGCIVENGPTDCEWDELTYVVFFILHLISLCGYFICLGMPLFLWSDVLITNNQENKEHSLFQCIETKKFLLISIACYGSLQLVRVFALLLGSDLTSHKTYQQNELHAVTSCLESIFIVLISAVWFFCGVRLQVYVMRVQFHPIAERRILFVINLVMLAILISYLLRAVLILSLFLETYHITVTDNFVFWIIGTRWIPYVFCSFLLILIMRRTLDSNPTPAVSEKECVSNDMYGYGADKVIARQKQKKLMSSNGRALSDQSSDDLRSSLSRESFLLYVADFDGAVDPGCAVSPMQSFSLLGSTTDILTGPGTPILGTINEEPKFSNPPSMAPINSTNNPLENTAFVAGRSSSAAASSISTRSLLSSGGTSASTLTRTNSLNGSLGGRLSGQGFVSNIGRGSDSLVASGSALPNVEDYSDDAFGDNPISGVRAPLLRRENSIRGAGVE